MLVAKLALFYINTNYINESLFLFVKTTNLFFQIKQHLTSALP